jgi:hypothetical protein
VTVTTHPELCRKARFHAVPRLTMIRLGGCGRRP